MTTPPHPYHDEIATCLRALYSEPIPDARIVVEQFPFGFFRYSRFKLLSGDIYLDGIEPAQVPELLKRMANDFANRSLNIYLDDRDKDALLGPALLAEGSERHDATIFLAYCGDIPPAVKRNDVSFERVRDDTELREAVRTKLMGFAHSEDEPPADALESEFAVRKGEISVGACYVLARVEGKVAAMISYYEMPDSLIFQLATRLPFRGRGIARHLMEQAIRRRLEAGARSVLVNGDEGGTPVRFYRRLGFVDEVYWRRRYSLPFPDSRVSKSGTIFS